MIKIVEDLGQQIKYDIPQPVKVRKYEVDIEGLKELLRSHKTLSNKEIAQKLFLSEGTVRNYLSSILSKLNLRDRTQLAIWAVESGLLTKAIDDE